MNQLASQLNDVRAELQASRAEAAAAKAEAAAAKADQEALRIATIEASNAQQVTIMGLQQSVIAQGQVTTQVAAAAGTKAEATVDIKALRQPVSLNDKKGDELNWGEFKFQAENYVSFMSTDYLSELKSAASSALSLDMDDMGEDTNRRSISLYALLSQWTSGNREARVLAQTLKGSRNGFELWRLLKRKFEPEAQAKGLTRRRNLLNPVFPKAEADFQTALEDWEADLLRYTEEENKEILEEDRRAVLLEVAPASIKQHLRQNILTLDTYEKLKTQVISYLESKNVWHGDGRVGNAYGAVATQKPKKDPTAMEIDSLRNQIAALKGKGKGGKEDSKGKGGKGAKGDPKGKGKVKPSPKQPKQPETDDKKCPVCWLRHLPDPCWYKGQGKGKGKDKGDPKGKGKGKGKKHLVAAYSQHEPAWTQAEWDSWSASQQQPATQQQQSPPLTLADLQQHLQQMQPSSSSQQSTTSSSRYPAQSVISSVTSVPTWTRAQDTKPLFDQHTGRRLNAIKSAPSRACPAQRTQSRACTAQQTLSASPSQQRLFPQFKPSWTHVGQIAVIKSRPGCAARGDVAFDIVVADETVEAGHAPVLNLADTAPVASLPSSADLDAESSDTASSLPSLEDPDTEPEVEDTMSRACSSSADNNPQEPASTYLEEMDDWQPFLHRMDDDTELHPQPRKVGRLCMLRQRFMIDSGACDNVVLPDTFPSGHLDVSARKTLYAVNDTPLEMDGIVRTQVHLPASPDPHAAWMFSAFQTESASEPILAVCKALDNNLDVHFSPHGCYFQSGNQRIPFYREEDRFYLDVEASSQALPHGGDGNGHPGVLAPLSQARARENQARSGDAPMDEAASDPPDSDEDRADMVQDHAMQPFDPAIAQAEIEAKEAEMAATDLLTLEEHARQQVEIAQQPFALSQPVAPSQEERDAHELLHLGLPAWCAHCVANKAKENAHYLQDPTMRKEIPEVQMDYMFFSRDGGEARDEESRLVTCLSAVNLETGWSLFTMLPRKGAIGYAVRALKAYLDEQHADSVYLRCDAENPIIALRDKVLETLGPKRIHIQQSPPYSHQSMGAVESVNAFHAAQFRTWLSVLKERYPTLDIDASHVVASWIPRHVAWCNARYHSKNGVTPYRATHGTEYSRPITPFGECVLAKIPDIHSISKQKPRWLHAVWIGRLDADDSHLLLTEEGLLQARSVRRLPLPACADSDIVAKAVGLPWSPKEGMRKHKAKKLKSLPVPEPLPVLTLTPDLALDGMVTPMPEKLPAEFAEDEVYEPEVLEGPQPRVASLPGSADSSSNSSDSSDSEPQMEQGAAEKRMAVTEDSPEAKRPKGEPSSPFRGAGSSSAIGSSSTAPVFPTGLGGGSVPTGAPPPPGAKVNMIKSTINAIAEMAERYSSSLPSSEDPANKSRACPGSADSQTQLSEMIASVVDLLDAAMTDEELWTARQKQIHTLDSRGAFFPELKSKLTPQDKRFNHVWVDKKSKGETKSRFTCADVKAKYTKEQNRQLDVHVPTPLPESHALLEVLALLFDWPMMDADVVAAFLIGKDSAASVGEHVYMTPPKEWDLQEWLADKPAELQAYFLGCETRDVMWRVDGNLYGRRTAGATYRHELQEILTVGLACKGFEFQIGVKDPTTYRCNKSEIRLLHHIDDFRSTGPSPALMALWKTELPHWLELKYSELQWVGSVVDALGKEKYRTKEIIASVPAVKHKHNILQLLGLSESNAKPSPVPSKTRSTTEHQEPLEHDRAAIYRSAVGSAIYLSLDRRDIIFAVKELARRLQSPLEVDWLALKLLGRYLLGPDKARITLVTELDKQRYREGHPLPLCGFSDSDWAGCPETRRSTGCIITVAASAITNVSAQTQPGLPATSSPDAEIREMSRLARELVFQKQLAELDFGLRVEVPELYADSAVGLQVSKKLGPGNKLRHLEVCHMYVQEAERAGLLKTKKVKGVENPANFLTKHPKDGKSVLEAMPALGMISVEDEQMREVLDHAHRLKVSELRSEVQQSSRPARGWQTPRLFSGNYLTLAALYGVMMSRGEAATTDLNTSSLPSSEEAAVASLPSSADQQLQIIAAPQGMNLDWHSSLTWFFLFTFAVGLMTLLYGAYRMTILVRGCLCGGCRACCRRSPQGETTSFADTVVHLSEECQYLKHSKSSELVSLRICKACIPRAAKRIEDGRIFFSKTALGKLQKAKDG